MRDVYFDPAQVVVFITAGLLTLSAAPKIAASSLAPPAVRDGFNAILEKSLEQNIEKQRKNQTTPALKQIRACLQARSPARHLSAQTAPSILRKMTLPAPPFLSALLLAEEESQAAVDRRSLRGAGIRHIRVVTSGCEVARFFAANIPNLEEVIVCPPRLADMDALRFAALIRSHPLLPHVPLVALTSNSSNREALEQAGFNAVLQRPFNSQELLKTLREAARRSRKAHAALAAWLRTLDKLPDHTEFDELLEACTPLERGALTASEACRRGMILLREHRWDDALPLLQKAAVDIETSGDANAALSALYRAKGEHAKAAQSLKESLRGYVDAQAWGKVSQVANCLFREASGEGHPLLGEIERAIRQGKIFVAQELMDILQPDADQSSTCPAQEEILNALNRGLSALSPAQAADARETLELALLQNGKKQLAHALDAPSSIAASYVSTNSGEIKASRSSINESATQTSPSSAPTSASSDISSGAAPCPSSAPSPGSCASFSSPDGFTGSSASVSTALPENIPLNEDTDAVIPPINDPAPLAPSRLPSLLGEVMTVIRGTLRLYKASK